MGDGIWGSGLLGEEHSKQGEQREQRRGEEAVTGRSDEQHGLQGAGAGRARGEEQGMRSQGDGDQITQGLWLGL